MLVTREPYKSVRDVMLTDEPKACDPAQHHKSFFFAKNLKQPFWCHVIVIILPPLPSEDVFRVKHPFCQTQMPFLVH